MLSHWPYWLYLFAPPYPFAQLPNIHTFDSLAQQLSGMQFGHGMLVTHESCCNTQEPTVVFRAGSWK